MLRRFGQENFVFVLCFSTVLVSVMGPVYLVAVAASRLPVACVCPSSMPAVVPPVVVVCARWLTSASVSLRPTRDLLPHHDHWTMSICFASVCTYCRNACC